MPDPVRSKPAESSSRILIVDDHPVVREGFTQLINNESDLKVCGQVATPPQALDAIPNLAPDLLVVDISLEGASGLELIKDIRAIHGDLPILALSMHDESIYAERAIRAGAKGYVMKKAPTQDVITAIRQILKGEVYVSRRIQSKLLGQTNKDSAAPRDIERLSDRELEVFRLVGNGFKTAQIAEKLHVSVKTIEAHRAKIKVKLNLDDAMDLLHLAIRWVNNQEKHF